MAMSLRGLAESIAEPAHLDESVEEVFRVMLGVRCVRESASTVEEVGIEKESVTAVVGLGGMLSGACVFRSSYGTAVRLAAKMTGMHFEQVDDVVKDGIGEICNMLAGTWKGKIPELAAHCGMSVPAVITGRDYQIHVQAPRFKLLHHYAFEGGNFSVIIVCDGLQ